MAEILLLAFISFCLLCATVIAVGIGVVMWREGSRPWRP